MRVVWYGRAIPNFSAELTLLIPSCVGQLSRVLCDRRVRHSAKMLLPRLTYAGRTSTWRYRQKRFNSRSTRFASGAWDFRLPPRKGHFDSQYTEVHSPRPYVTIWEMAMVASMSSHSPIRRGSIVKGCTQGTISLVSDRKNSRPPPHEMHPTSCKVAPAETETKLSTG